MMSEDTQLPAWFQVFSKALDVRLDKQDRMLSHIFREARKTNGRVTDLESYRNEQTLLEEDRATRTREVVSGREKAISLRRWKWEVGIGTVAMAFGGSIYPVGQAIGLW